MDKLPLAKGPAPQPGPPVVTVTVHMHAGGTVSVSCTKADALDPLAVFHAIGQGMALLANKFAEKAQNRIEVAPPGMVPLLAN